MSESLDLWRGYRIRVTGELPNVLLLAEDLERHRSQAPTIQVAIERQVETTHLLGNADIGSALITIGEWVGGALVGEAAISSARAAIRLAVAQARRRGQISVDVEEVEHEEPEEAGSDEGDPDAADAPR